MWWGEREMNIREVERLCESVRGRERKIESGVEREVNVGERGRCRIDSGTGGGRDRLGRGRESVCESVRGGESKTKRRCRDKV
jgi:hypothetical protein